MYCVSLITSIALIDLPEKQKEGWQNGRYQLPVLLAA